MKNPSITIESTPVKLKDLEGHFIVDVVTGNDYSMFLSGQGKVNK
jgi:hypothetical protein